MRDFPNLQDAAAGWLGDFGVPYAFEDRKDLAGRVVRVCSLIVDSHIEFFFPRRTLPFHQRMVKLVTATLRRRGASISRVAITPEDYARWMERHGRKDSPELRYAFATRIPVDAVPFA